MKLNLNLKHSKIFKIPSLKIILVLVLVLANSMISLINAKTLILIHILIVLKQVSTTVKNYNPIPTRKHWPG